MSRRHPERSAGIKASGRCYVTSYSMTEVRSDWSSVRERIGCDRRSRHARQDCAASSDRKRPSRRRACRNVLPLESCSGQGPKILINVETDDFGILEERDCGCPLGDLGLHQHLRQIRSVGKLTGRGITLVASDIVDIIEDILPGKFGGTAQDYQLVEEEDEGTGATQPASAGRVHRFTLTDEDAPARALLEALSQGTSRGKPPERDAAERRGRSRATRTAASPSDRGKLPAFRTVASR